MGLWTEKRTKAVLKTHWLRERKRWMLRYPTPLLPLSPRMPAIRLPIHLVRQWLYEFLKIWKNIYLMLFNNYHKGWDYWKVSLSIIYISVMLQCFMRSIYHFSSNQKNMKVITKRSERVKKREMSPILDELKKSIRPNIPLELGFLPKAIVAQVPCFG